MYYPKLNFVTHQGTSRSVEVLLRACCIILSVVTIAAESTSGVGAQIPEIPQGWESSGSNRFQLGCCGDWATCFAASGHPEMAT